MQQLSLIPPTPRFHGGNLAIGKRKVRRPLSRKDPIHSAPPGPRPPLRSGRFARWLFLIPILFEAKPNSRGSGAIQWLCERAIRPSWPNCHFTLKAKTNLYKSRAQLLEHLTRLARQFGIELFDLAMSFDHIHFVAKIRSRRDYASFIRSFTGLIARQLGKGIWKLLPFSRVGRWGKDFREMRAYCEKNREEALGHQPYEPRKDWYKKWRPEVPCLEPWNKCWS